MIAAIILSSPPAGLFAVQDDDGRRLLETALAAIARCPSVTGIYAIGQDRAQLDFYAGHGCRTIQAEIAESGEEKLLPAGTIAALAALKRAVPEARDIICLPQAAVFLDSGVIERAVRTYRNGKARIVASAVKPREHPCQLYQYLSFVHTGLLVFLEPDDWGGWPELPEDYRVSREFPFPWADHGVFAESPGAYRLALEEESIIARPGLKPLDPALEPGADAIWLWTSPALARCALRVDALPHREARAVEWPWRPRGAYARNGEPGWLDLIFPGLPEEPERSKIRFSPCASPALRKESAGARKGEDLPFPYRLPEPPEEVWGLTYSIFAYKSQSNFDFCIPFQHDGSLWTFDEQTLERINVASDNKILGRQDFPDCYQANRALAVLDADVLEHKELLNDLASYNFAIVNYYRHRIIENKYDLMIAATCPVQDQDACGRPE